jgi:iron(III) transport system substrate-binding protein
VVVYVALDRTFSEPIFEAFTRKTGIAVKPLYDTESTKTVGLASRIRAEAARPRCDVFWNNEILNTIRLESEGLLQPFDAAGAEGYPEGSRDRDKTWYGFAARARVLIVNTRVVSRESMPGSIRDLARPEWKGRTAIAKPLFGTTASHVACLFAALGADRATEYLDSLKKNDVRVEGGNKGCAMAVAAGAAAFALTDTDDAIAEVEAGKPVTIVYPDSGEDGLGTLFLPNTVAILKGAPHPEEAKALVNFLLTPEVEEMLAGGPSAQIPLNEAAKPSARVQGPGQVKPMSVDYEAAAACFEEARKVVEGRFLK